MPKTDYSRFVVGYHGCDAAVARKALVGEEDLDSSNNKYDWLGNGIYFWEQGPARAFQFAADEARRSSKKIKTPDVLGAYIYLGNCFDLLDVRYTKVLSELFGEFKRGLREQGFPQPTNRTTRPDGTKLFHDLDRAVIEFAVAFLERDNQSKIETVRCGFQEGERAFPGAEIYRQTHIQIAVRNPDCILGYFKPKAV